MLAHRERRLFTPAEYLSIEELAEVPSEYYRGEIFSMTGGSLEHSRLIRNLGTLIDNALLGQPCELFGSNLRLHVARHDLFTYPDLYVVCGPPATFVGRTDTLVDATLIVEVLSPKTELYDRGEKFVFYQGLRSFKEYLLVSQRELKVERFLRQSRGGWSSENFGPGESVPLKSIRCDLPVEAIYRGVDLTRSDEEKTD